MFWVLEEEKENTGLSTHTHNTSSWDDVAHGGAIVVALLCGAFLGIFFYYTSLLAEKCILLHTSHHPHHHF